MTTVLPPDRFSEVFVAAASYYSKYEAVTDSFDLLAKVAANKATLQWPLEIALLTRFFEHMRQNPKASHETVREAARLYYFFHFQQPTAEIMS